MLPRQYGVRHHPLFFVHYLRDKFFSRHDHHGSQHGESERETLLPKFNTINEVRKKCGGEIEGDRERGERDREEGSRGDTREQRRKEKEAERRCACGLTTHTHAHTDMHNSLFLFL